MEPAQNYQRTSLFIFILVFLLDLSGHAQAPLVKQWDHKYGGNKFDIHHSFQRTSDGGYSIFGYTESDSTGEVTQLSRGNADYWLVKTDSNGVKQWDSRFGGADIDVGLFHIQTTNNDFLLGGYSISDPGGDKSAARKGYSDFWVIRTTSAGVKLWDRTYGGGAGEAYIINYIDQTNDGGFIIGGTASGGIGGDNTHPNRDTTNATVDYWIIRVDAFGNKLWDQRYGGISNDELYSVTQTPDGGFLVTGKSFSGVGGDKTQPSQGGNDIWVVKTDISGNKIWDRRYGGSGDEIIGGVVVLPDGKIILGAQSDSPVSGDKTQPLIGMSDIWVLKLDISGTILWDKNIGGYNAEEIQNLVSDQQGNIFIAADSYSSAGGDKSENNLGLEQSWIVKLDGAGNIVWDKTILTNGHDETTKAVSDELGCLVVVNFSDGTPGGYNTHAPRGLVDYWMVKFCDTTFVSGTVEPLLNANIFPNPFSESITIEMETKIGTNKIMVTDLSGRVIYSIVFSGQKVIDANKWSKGFYVISVEADNRDKSIIRKLFVKT